MAGGSPDPSSTAARSSSTEVGGRGVFIVE